MEKAIQKAIEGGWKVLPDLPSDKNDIEKLEAIYGGSFDKGGIGETYFKKACVLDPLFWQALGKAEGWKREVCMFDGGSFDGSKDVDTPDGPGEWHSNCEKCGVEGLDKYEFPEGNIVREWQYHWRRFIDHLAEGKDINSFFEELLSHE